MTWKDKLHDALIRGHFSEQDLDDASHWGSCAVGEVEGVASGPYVPPPSDPVLESLGMQFFQTLQHQRQLVYEAMDVLHQIEERAKELKAKDVEEADKETVQA